MSYDIPSGSLSTPQAVAFRANLKRFRDEVSEVIGEDFTQEMAADAAGLKLDIYRSYEGGKRYPKVANLVRLAEVFQRPMDDFLAAEPPAVPRSRRPKWFARAVLVGNVPPGLAAEIEAVIARHRGRPAAAAAPPRRKHPSEVPLRGAIVVDPRLGAPDEPRPGTFPRKRGGQPAPLGGPMRDRGAAKRSPASRPKL